jgi:hypothetical protein
VLIKLVSSLNMLRLHRHAVKLSQPLFFDTGAAHPFFWGRNIIAATLINDKAPDGGS